jgi:hypothetical protein
MTLHDKLAKVRECIDWVINDSMADKCKEAYAILDEIAAEIPVWKPIETATNDKKIIVYSPKYGECFAVRRMWNADDMSDSQWVIARSEDTTFIVRDATHWMPLPAAPKGGDV